MRDFASAAQSSGAEISGEGEAVEEKANILIVDDLPEKLLAFQTILEELDQNLVLVHSGSEALREVLQREFAVILLDVNMPDIDGMETAGLIRQYKRSAHTPIIFITTYADEMQTAHGYSLGAVDYILSPIRPDVLRSKVKVFVELFQMQQRIRLMAKAEAARSAAEETTWRSNFIARASRELSASLDMDEGLRRLLELVVPRMAEMAIVALEDESQRMLLRTSRRGADAAAGTAPERRHDEHPDDPDLPEADSAAGEPLTVTVESDSAATSLDGLPDEVARALRMALHDGEPGEVTLRDLAAPRSPASLAWPEALRSVLTVPLRNGDKTVGALLLATRKPAPAYSDRDVAMLLELGSRAAMALDNAGLYRNLQREIARSRQAEEELQDASRRKDEFLAMLSHELRNPLAPIRTAVEVIRRVAPSDPTLNMAREVVDRQVTHLVRLVEELLDVARISEGKITLKKESVELGQVLRHSIETARPLIESRRQTLLVDAPSAPVRLFGDAARLGQVMGNLLNNAAKYTQEGGRIELKAVADGGEAVIQVKDNGGGIDARLLPKIFELFVQGERSLDRSQGGLGVGLTLVRRIVELHDGRVEAHSEGIGKGATFRVVLPCVSAVLDDSAPARAAPPGGCASRQGGRRVLVVDDNADAAECTAAYLRLEGHDVRTLFDGDGVLSCARVFAPHVVVLDIGLPGISGYDVARQLRNDQQTCDALLIAVTGYGQKEDRIRAAAAGFDLHYVKPADPREIQVAIQASQKASPARPGANPLKSRQLL